MQKETSMGFLKSFMLFYAVLFLFECRNAAADGKLHGFGGTDVCNRLHSGCRQKKHVARNGIRSRDIHRHIAVEAEIRHVALRDESHAPHIIVINIGKHRAVELFLFAGKGFKKIFYRRINKPDTGGFFKPAIEQAEQPRFYEKGRK
jgi:hypothetical protein